MVGVGYRNKKVSCDVMVIKERARDFSLAPLVLAWEESYWSWEMRCPIASMFSS